MGSRIRNRAAAVAEEVGTEHPDTEESGEENSLIHWIVLGPKIGPLCALCKTWLATRQHPEHGAVCIKCKEAIDKDLMVWYWSMLKEPNGSAVSHEIRRLVAGYIWGEGANAFCYCGLCQGSWLSDGWICYGD